MVLGRRTLSPICLLAAVITGCTNAVQNQGGTDQAATYAVSLDRERPLVAEVTLPLPTGRSAPLLLAFARDGDGASIQDAACADGGALVATEAGYEVPAGCEAARWSVALTDMDADGIDASLPRSSYSPSGGFWLIAERDGFLRHDGLDAEEAGPALTVTLAEAGGDARSFLFPTVDQPPFYAVVGTAPSRTIDARGLSMRVHGQAPPIGGIDEVQDEAIAALARLRDATGTENAPAVIDWAWLPTTAEAEPGFAASAGAEAIFAQVKPRESDPDAEAKARAVIGASSVHEGFHVLTGADAHAWPAWVNESLANHFAIEASRSFLSEADFAFVEAFYVRPDPPVPLLVAQAAYEAGDGAQAGVFYTRGARFWREVEAVLTTPPTEGSRLATVLARTDGFAGVDLNDADALAAMLGAYSDGAAEAVVRCYLHGEGCPGEAR